MLKIKVNGQDFIFDQHSGSSLLDGKPVQADSIKLTPSKYHLIINNQSILVELLSKTEDGKGMVILVNGSKQEVTLKDKYDELLSSLGMDKMLSHKKHHIKAPMPGLVLRIMVNEGDQVKKGDALLVLEAMKMENAIKADSDGVVKKISVQPKQAVEKNTMLVEME